MGPSRYSRRVTGLILGMLLFHVLPGTAQETNAPATPESNRLRLAVDIRSDVAGTYMPYRYAFITASDQKYTFLVPDGYRVDTSDPAKIKLASPDFSSLITLNFLANQSPPIALMDAEALQTHVLANFPNATIKSGQTVSAIGQAAPALDFNWKTDSGITRTSRIAFFSTPSGIMECTLTTSPDQFTSSLAQLNLVMLTFRSGTNGKFDYVVGSKYP